MSAEFLPMLARAADSNNDVLSGAKWYFYATGTTTPQSVYTTSDLDVPHANPVVADSGGKFAPIYLDGSLTYRGVLKSSDGATTIFDFDPINNGILQFLQSGNGAESRSYQDKMRERVSVLDFGADPTGEDEATTAFQNAAASNLGGEIYIPEGTYKVGNIGWLNYAGTRWLGASKYTTVLKAKAGLTGAIFSNTNSASGSTAYCAIENIHFDLNGEDCTAVDLASVNNSVVRDCFINGALSYAATTTSGSAVISGLSGGTSRLRAGQAVFGTNLAAGTTILSVDSTTQITLSANATGTGATNMFVAGGVGIKFDAPYVGGGAYNNMVENCTGLSLNIGVEWGEGGNLQQVIGSEWTGCNYGYYAYNASTPPDTPTVIGGRVENCSVGILEGATQGCYINIRFEASHTCDIEFTASSTDAQFVGGYTASSTLVTKNRNLAVTPHIPSPDLGWYDVETSTSRPRLVAARHTFAAAGSVPAVSPATTAYSVYFQDFPLLGNQVALEAANYNAGTSDNRVVVASVDASDNVNITAFRRKDSSYGNVNLSENLSARPTGLFYAGTKILGTQGAAVADASGGATVDAEARTAINTLLARLRAHGIIAT